MANINILLVLCIINFFLCQISAIMLEDTKTIIADQKEERTTVNEFGEKEVITYKNGKRNGSYKRYYKTNVLCVEANFQHNKLDGLYKYYSETGELHTESNYKDDMLNGKYCVFYKNGVLKSRTDYKDDKLHGENSTFYEDGKLETREYYGEGIKENRYCIKYNGEQKLEEYKFYHKNGRLSAKRYFQDGALKGKSQYWYENGQMSEEYNYVTGVVEMEEKKWNIDGTLTYHTDGKKIIVTLDEKGRDCALPDGKFECWKACKTKDGTKVYVKLFVPKDAKRVTTHSYNKKGRVEYARVAQIVDKDGKEYKKAYSFVHEDNVGFEYELYDEVWPDEYDNDPHISCGKGINVFMHQDMCDEYI